MRDSSFVVGVIGGGSTWRNCADAVAAAGITVIAAGPAELDRIGDADVVIEALPPGEADAAATLLRELAAVCGLDTVLVGTSVRALAAAAIATGAPDRVAGLRWVLPLVPGAGVELVTTTMTSPRAVTTIEKLLARMPWPQAELGPAHAVAKDLALGMLNRAMLLAGAGDRDGRYGIDSIDTAMRLGCGLSYGPLELLDQIGLDVALAELTALYTRTGRADHAPAPVLRELVVGGKLGRSTGSGFRDYPRPAPTPVDARASTAIGSVGLLGSGTMGQGIAQALAVGGIDTVLVGRDPERTAAALARIDAAMIRAVRRGHIEAGQRRDALRRLRCTTDLGELAEVGLVVEAVTEDAAVKRAVFARLDEVCGPDTILATATSSLSVAGCAAATAPPRTVVGMHFFHPAPIMKLVEVTATDRADDAAMAAVLGVVDRLGKTAIRCPDTPGFLVNKLLFPYLADAIDQVRAGTGTIADLDLAVRRGLGFPVGPFELMDTIGLDVCAAIAAQLDPEHRGDPMLDGLIAAGRLGRKTEAGFHRHSVRWRHL